VLFPKKSPLLTLLKRDGDDRRQHAAAFKDFWVAPEVIRNEGVQVINTTT
jgi:hypothetical protein